MEPSIYLKMDRLEQEHWWFAGRRNIIESLLHTRLTPLDSDSRILDAGCGTGGNLGLLSRLGCEVSGLEMDRGAAEIARWKSGKSVYVGSLPDGVPFADESFDLIVLLDVLEHIDDDVGALRTLASKLKPGGSLLITVPAFSFLWSRHDESHHHKRRYRLRELTDKMRQCRLRPIHASYFNTWLFPVIALVRILQRRLGPTTKSDDLTLPSPVLNKLLAGILSSERHLLKFAKLPFGVSIAAIGRKT
ncbi:methyltransferase domain-containing protein [Cohnella sp. CFH 77786]|uniref:class I SAM-dependent methyltransferase n=1 Tax=Cohnella sp. CFH 77786 TaxID=2662265 RepID=UPI001C60E7CD|nr:class I SAM-dependent methyltransferase [Cohnella sp. CFH 77786]MBW5447522.1 methyltransferase domain-containing protein [Cohnella sp. CFH 77786]